MLKRNLVILVQVSSIDVDVDVVIDGVIDIDIDMSGSTINASYLLFAHQLLSVCV